jgi:Sel1 repeat
MLSQIFRSRPLLAILAVCALLGTGAFLYQMLESVGFDAGISAYERNDFATALKSFSAEAKRGNATAQVFLGIMYEKGSGVPRDEQQAVAWFRKAADQGDAVGQYNIGTMFASGRGVSKDEQQAVTWYRKAADQNYSIAQAALGEMFSGGRGVTKDEQEACWRSSNIDHLCSSKFDQGLGPPVLGVGCG